MNYRNHGSNSAGCCQYREYWIAPQPTLAVLYLNLIAPGLVRAVINRVVGPKRVDMWREGLDVYDPGSWRRRKP